MSALRRILDALIPGSPARAAQPNRVAQIGSAGRMNPNNTKIGKALQNAELGGEYMPAQPISPAQRDFPGRTNYGVPEDDMIDTPRGYVSHAEYNLNNTPLRNRPTFAGNLNPPTEDGYDSTIKYLVGFNQRGRNPMPMGSIPTNNTYARTGYYQGSNPLGNVPERNLYQNISPFDEDTILPGNRVQSPSLDRYYNRY